MSIRRFVVCGLIATSTIALVGCGDGSPAASGPTGDVHGVIMMAGGPPAASPTVTAGTVIVHRGRKQVGRQHITEGQQFRFSLPPGTYKMSVLGVSAPCVDTNVTVTAGTDQAVSLVCQRK